MAQYTGTWGSNPSFDWIVDLNEVGRSETSATIRVQLRLKLHGSNSSTFFGYPLNWKCSCLGVDSGWMEVKTAARWYGGQDYRSYTRDLTIPADNGGKTVGINIKTDSPGYTLSTGEFNWDYNFTISTRNSAPWWTSDDTRMNDIKAHVIIPENWGNVNVKSATAWDNEQGGNLNYDIHRHINGSYNAQIKWGGSGIDVTDNIAPWGQGTRIKYEAKVHDGQGGWADGSRWSWEYTKNTFNKCTVSNIATIDNSTTGLRYDILSARNSGAGNGYVNNSYGYRMECLTPGVTMYGNCELGGDGSTINVIVGIDKGSGTPNPHYFKFNEIKSYLSDKGYKGTLRLRINCWNSYGSNGSYDFDVPVDLRINPNFTTITYSADSKITHAGASYYIPAYVPLKCSWTHVQDPMNGGNCTYDILYQIGDGQYVYIDSTSSNSYTAYLGSTPIGNSNQSQFRIIIRAKTSYGYSSDSGGPRIDLKSYSPCSVQVNSVTRNKTNVVISGRLTANTSITGVTFTNSAWGWSSGGSGSGTFSASSGTFSITVNAGQEVSGIVRITSSDSVRNEIIKINSNVDMGSGNANIKSYVPTMSWRKNTVGINCYPDGSAALEVAGRLKVNGNIIDGITQGMYCYGQEMTEDEEFDISNNRLAIYNNMGNGNVVIEKVSDSTAPTGSKKALKVTNNGAATPGHGGVTWQHQTYANAAYTYAITAKIPSGRELVFAGNSYGDGAKFEWLTPNKGTDKYETYIGRATCGATGTFSTIGFFYISGGSTGFSWYIARANFWNNDRQSTRINLRHTVLDGSAPVAVLWSQRDTLNIAGKIETMLSANITHDGKNYIHIDKNQGACQIIMHGNSFPQYRWSNKGDAEFGVCQFSRGYEVLTEHPEQGVIKSKPYFQEINRDLNNIIEPGTYPGILTNCSNKPPVGYDFGALLVFTSMGFVVQLWIPHHSSKLCYRLRWGDGNWGGWQATQ